MKEHNGEILLSAIEIKEALIEQDHKLIYPIMRQLRTTFTDADIFLNTVKRIQKNGYKLFFASFKHQMSSQVVGAIGLRIQEDLCWGRHLYVDDLVVDEALRGRGIGQYLMNFAKDLAIAESCQYLRLASGLKRHEAHRFYENLGYKKTSFTFAIML